MGWPKHLILTSSPALGQHVCPNDLLLLLYTPSFSRWSQLCSSLPYFARLFLLYDFIPPSHGSLVQDLARANPVRPFFLAVHVREFSALGKVEQVRVRYLFFVFGVVV